MITTVRLPALRGLAYLLGVLVLLSPPRAEAQQTKIQRLGGGRFLSESVRELPAAGISSLKISGPANLGGSLNVNTRTGTTVRLEMAKVFKVTTEAQAAEFEQQIEFVTESAGGVLTVTIRSQKGASWEGREQSARVELSITIPRDWNVEFRGQYFEMDLSGPFRSVDVQTQYGRVKLADVSERVRLSGDYTAIEAIDARGDIAIANTYADLVLRNAIPSAERPARLTSRYGSIVVEKLAGAVAAETENAPIFLSDVVLIDAGSTLRSTNAMVKADIREFSNAQLDVTNDNGTVILKVPENLSARINCQVGSGGSIITSGLVIQTHPNLIASDRLEGICGDGRGAIDVDISGPGQVAIQGR